MLYIVLSFLEEGTERNALNCGPEVLVFNINFSDFTNTHGSSLSSS